MDYPIYLVWFRTDLPVSVWIRTDLPVPVIWAGLVRIYLFFADLSVISLSSFFLQSLPFLHLLGVGKGNAVNSLEKKKRIKNHKTGLKPVSRTLQHVF